MELKMNMARNMYGMHAPIKMAMERSLVVKARGPSMLPRRSNLGLDILNGKDETIDFEDFLNGKSTFCLLSAFLRHSAAADEDRAYMDCDTFLIFSFENLEFSSRDVD